MSIRQAIVTEVATRLQAIAVANGYQTDAGQLLFIGETPHLGTDDPPFAIALIIGDDAPSDQSGYGVDQAGVVVTQLPIDCQVAATTDPARLQEPWLTVEAVLADIQHAIESEDRSLGGLLTKNLERGRVRPFRREPGSTIVGLSAEYRATFASEWGSER